jgi:tRNA G37 N-methylase Trm5
MIISSLPSQYLINVVRKVGAIKEQFESDFLLRAIRIENTADETIHLKKVRSYAPRQYHIAIDLKIAPS